MRRSCSTGRSNKLEDSGWVQRLCLGLLPLPPRRRVRRWTQGYPVVVTTYPLASQTLGQLRDAGELDAVHRHLPHRPGGAPDVGAHLGGPSPHGPPRPARGMGRLVYRTPMRPVGGLVSPRFKRAAQPGAPPAHCARSWGCVRDRPVAPGWSPARSAWGRCPARCARIAGTGAAPGARALRAQRQSCVRSSPSCPRSSLWAGAPEHAGT